MNQVWYRVVVQNILTQIRLKQTLTENKGNQRKQSASDIHTPCKHQDNLTQLTTNTHRVTLQLNRKKNSTQRDISFPPIEIFSESPLRFIPNPLKGFPEPLFPPSIRGYAMAQSGSELISSTQSCPARNCRSGSKVHLGDIVHILYK